MDHNCLEKQRNDVRKCKVKSRQKQTSIQSDGKRAEHRERENQRRKETRQKQRIALNQTSIQSDKEWAKHTERENQRVTEIRQKQKLALNEEQQKELSESNAAVFEKSERNKKQGQS